MGERDLHLKEKKMKMKIKINFACGGQVERTYPVGAPLTIEIKDEGCPACFADYGPTNSGETISMVEITIEE
jgi:hypothetical protein